MSPLPVSADAIIDGRTQDPDPLLAQVITPLEYGARGDGVTDDTTEVNLAIEAAGDSLVYFPAGTYLVSAALLPVSGQTWVGDGASSVIKLKAATNTNVVTCTDLTDVTFRNLKLDGNKANQTDATTAVLYVESCSNVAIDHVEIADGKGFNLKLTGATDAHNYGVSITDCYFHGSGQELINSRATHQLRAHGNHFKDWGADTAANPCWAIGFGGSGYEDTDFTIDGNTFTNVAAGQFALEAPNYSAFAEGFVVTGNVFDGNSLRANGISGYFSQSVFSGNVHKNGYGDWRSGYELWCVDTVISGNVIENGELWVGNDSARVKILGNVITTALTAAQGIKLYSAEGYLLSDVDVVGNSVTLTHASPNSAIAIGPDGSGFAVNHILVSGNTLRGPSGVAGYGIRLIGGDGSSDIVITNNTLVDFDYAINVAATAYHDEVTISGNDVRGNTYGVRNQSTGGTIRINNNILADNQAHVFSGGLEVTGDRSDGVALTNLLIALETMGIITDSSTA